MGKETKDVTELEELFSEDFVPQINNNRIFWVWWSDNGVDWKM
jgi:hypothetical protein